MNIKRAKSIITFVEELTTGEKKFLESLMFSERTTNATVAHKTIAKKKRRTRVMSGPVEHYDDQQILYAWELLQKGENRYTISEKTGIKPGSVMKSFLLQRIANMEKKKQTELTEEKVETTY